MPEKGAALRYARLVQALIKNPKVVRPVGKRGFGSSGLYVGGKLFAFLSYKNRLIAKLPARRVEELVAQGEGTRWNPRGSGRALREWFVLRPSSGLEWSDLAREAMEFAVSSRREQSA
jgi:TfoX/Sxy family transcriptional regulator of competence genes